MMLDRVSYQVVLTGFVDSSSAADLEQKSAMLLAATQASDPRGFNVEGWSFGGSGFGPNFLLAVEYTLPGDAGLNAIPMERTAFFFYSAASALRIAQARAAAMARIAAFQQANFPDSDVEIVDSLLAGGSQGLTQMGMLVVAGTLPP